MDIDANHATPGFSDGVKDYETLGEEDVKVSLGFEDGDAPLRCRACLLPGRKLFDIHEYKLADAFARVTGTPVYKDRLPQHLCWYCRAVLLRGDAFRDKCLRSQERLMAELRGELATEYIRTDSQLPNLTLSTIQTVDCTGVTPADQIKDEPDIDIVDIERIMNKTVLKTEKSRDELRISNRIENETTHVKQVKDVKKPKRIVKKKIEIENDNDEDSDSFDAEKSRDELRISNRIENKTDVKQVKDVKKPKRIVKKKIEIENDNDEDSDSFDAEKIEIEFGADDEVYTISIDVANPAKKAANSGKKTKGKKIKNELGSEESKDLDVDTKPKVRRRKKKHEVMRKFRNSENDFMPVFDFAKFESTCAVKIVALTKDEQLGEIASRKQSANYQESPFRCEDCGKGFLAQAPFDNHRLRHNPGAGPYACEICNARFKMKCRRQEHQDRHRLKFFCTECSFVSRARHQARKHHAMHAGKTYECQHCGKSFNKCSTHLSHVRLAHPAMNVACGACGETFLGQVGLRQHKAKMHPEITKPQFKCTTCPASFVSSDALDRHTDSGEHAGSACEQCGESCASEAALQAHVGERHPSESHRCEECNATFSSAASYELHHRRKHLNQPYSAAGRPAVRVNRRTAPGQYVCEQCGCIKPNPTLLRLHQRIHKDVKPFACPQCPKTFAAKHARDWHLRSHTGERPFQCPLCPLAFSINSNFKRHHKAVHLGQRARVPCAICERVFTTKSCLRVHTDKVHRGVPWPKRDRKRKKAAKE